MNTQAKTECLKVAFKILNKGGNILVHESFAQKGPHKNAERVIEIADILYQYVTR